jgi:hypothetical protein
VYTIRGFPTTTGEWVGVGVVGNPRIGTFVRESRHESAFGSIVDLFDPLNLPKLQGQSIELVCRTMRPLIGICCQRSCSRKTERASRYPGEMSKVGKAE